MTDPENPEEQARIAPQSEGDVGAVIDALTKEAADHRDRLLRTLAEMENLRKRTEREVADARSYGIAKFARDILDIADNMHRALEAVPDEARASDSSGLKALIEGVELTERSLASALERHGVKRFDPAGEKFNPNLQQAMYEVPDASIAPGTIVQVIQPGYMIGERVLRPAMVAISKGAAKQPAADAESKQEG